MPDLYSPSMPDIIKERYQVALTGQTALPCDDRKVADAIECQGFVVYCTHPNQRISLTVQGTGNVYQVDETCRDFLMMDDFNWDEAQDTLNQSNEAFNTKYSQMVGELDTVSFTNKYGKR